jgi:dUTP pyrophosphatase
MSTSTQKEQRVYLKYKKLWGGVKSPNRANPSDAGLDVFWCPKPGTGPHHRINPGQSILYETGLAFEVPHGYMLEVKNRGSMGSKGLIVGACVVDPGYSGHVFINLNNVSSAAKHLEYGQKIAQLVLIPVVHFIPEEVEEIYQNPVAISDRGAGALGSTN